ncbi:non-heme iron oxygenase ferredoxin subunit [Xanthomonadaceae bacterium JHOS43]|nr:non-heme iron oxygenase ferredoxin subunit [Xanthomonadaceae bacterium JHOS43]
MSTEGWTVLCATAEVLPGETHVAWFDDVALVVINFDGMFYALEDRCTHDEFELSAGPFDPGTGQIECVLHGARFDVRSGEAMCAPAYEPVRKYPLKVEDGVIYVRDPDA